MIGSFIAYFFAGTFLANAIPHFVMGISGRRFPKRLPFRKGGDGENKFERFILSSVANVIWGMINLFLVLVLLNVGDFILGYNIKSYVFVAGFIVCSIFLAWNFGRVESEK